MLFTENSLFIVKTKTFKPNNKFYFTTLPPRRKILLSKRFKFVVYKLHVFIRNIVIFVEKEEN